eukprot:gene12993-5356_t
MAVEQGVDTGVRYGSFIRTLLAGGGGGPASYVDLVFAWDSLDKKCVSGYEEYL